MKGVVLYPSMRSHKEDIQQDSKLIPHKTSMPSAFVVPSHAQRFEGEREWHESALDKQDAARSKEAKESCQGWWPTTCDLTDFPSRASSPCFVDVRDAFATTELCARLHDHGEIFLSVECVTPFSLVYRVGTTNGFDAWLRGPPYHEAFLTPGSSFASAFMRNWYCFSIQEPNQQSHLASQTGRR